MKEKKSLLLQTVKQMNIGAIVSGIGFLLYLGTAAMNLEIVKGLVAIVFGAISLYVFLSVASAREKDKETFTYSLLWGSGAMAIMLCGIAFLTIKMWLGF